MAKASKTTQEFFLPLRTQAAGRLQKQIDELDSTSKINIFARSHAKRKIKRMLDAERQKTQAGAEIDIEAQSSDSAELSARLSLDRDGDSKGTVTYGDSKKVFNENYKTYEGQVLATAEKYYNRDPLGASLVKAIVGLRTAFITGEEISVSSDNTNFIKWVESFLAKNKFHSDVLVPAVRALELTGQVILAMEPAEYRDMSEFIEVNVVVYNTDRKIRPSFISGFVKKFAHVEVQETDKGGRATWKKIPLDEDEYVYICAGSSKTDTSIIGSGSSNKTMSSLSDGNTEIPDICKTRIGAALNYIDNYDRGMRDMRLLNASGARITPSFKTEDPKNAAQIIKYLKKSGWEIGKAFVGSAELTYALPEHTGPQDGLTNELVGNIKSVTSVTGVPVHWLGYTEILSNRSTAETLYDLIKNSTINDRGNVEYSIYDLICKAQEMDDSISEPELNFKVILPLIDFSAFDVLVAGLSEAYNDEAISLQDYMSSLPGIDPTKTRRLVAEEKKNKEGRLFNTDRTAPNVKLSGSTDNNKDSNDTEDIEDAEDSNEA